MLKRIGLSMALAAGLIAFAAPRQAKAETHFGVYVGAGPRIYTAPPPAYGYDPYAYDPYADSYNYPPPVYSYPAPAYAAPYDYGYGYGYYGRGWRDHDRHEWREHERHEEHEYREHHGWRR